MALLDSLKKLASSEAARPLLLVAVILVGWDIAVRIFKIPPYLIPAPSLVVEQVIAQWPLLLRESLPTLYATLGGFLLSALFGIPVALLIASSRTIESYLYPLLVFSQSVPKIAVAPLFVVWFGFGIVPKIIAAFLLGFFPVVVSTVLALKSIDQEMIDLARSMRAGPLRTFLRIRLPHALPGIFGGLKVSITLAVVGAVVGEFVGSNSGIGYVLQIANGNFDLPLMFAALFVLSMMGVILFMALDLLEHLMIPWHASRRTGGGGAA
ncbi:ABC transporter permease [Xanthobacter oligotrophicus]|uniref:ABC transporter permease n=1 Tax=Xanthobacter oligotrophicus TaxID=2607286 RepID=UPI0011F26C9C|nr:ABC transporter permease [Xanthobacter oligotrophicus]MCG5235638.1 ABC transporter permease [Xanthobacter oligotrophicus]